MKYTVALLLLLFHFVYAGILQAQVTDSVFYEGSPGYDNQTNQQKSFSAVDPASLSPTQAYSNEKITVRKFDPQKWKDIVGDTDYNEGQEKRKLKKKKADPSTQSGEKSGEPGKRYLEREEEDMEEEQAPDNSSSVAGPLMALVLKILFYAIVIALIGFILYYIIRNVSFKSTSTKARIGAPDFTTQVEDIAELDVDNLLQRTLAAGDFRLAIRMCFLGLLKKLNEEGFIVWKKDKTNRDYLTELFSKPNYYEEVRRLTLAYEEIWYGDHTLPTESYQKLITEFKSIDQKLHTPNPR